MKLIDKKVRKLQMNKLLLVIMLFLIPKTVFASNGNDDFPISKVIIKTISVPAHTETEDEVSNVKIVGVITD